MDAHYGLTTTLDYYKVVHGRNSFDGRGGGISAYTYFGKNYNNAYYNNVSPGCSRTLSSWEARLSSMAGVRMGWRPFTCSPTRGMPPRTCKHLLRFCMPPLVAPFPDMQRAMYFGTGSIDPRSWFTTCKETGLPPLATLEIMAHELSCARSLHAL